MEEELVELLADDMPDIPDIDDDILAIVDDILAIVDVDILAIEDPIISIRFLLLFFGLFLNSSIKHTLSF